MLRSDYNVDQTKPLNVSSNVLFSDVPLEFITHPNTRDIRPLTDINAVRQAVKILVLSNYTDRPFHPELGGNVTRYLFENANKFTAVALRDEILRVIQRNEPRVTNEKVEIQLDEDRNRILVTLLFTIKLSNINTEVSFYLDRIR
jgi:phage baseplate assembly protein W|tara:strand:- start:14060 stop:14494 length:435 start_codon:yes stop_codon:yes gene_type:complete